MTTEFQRHALSLLRSIRGAREEIEAILGRLEELDQEAVNFLMAQDDRYGKPDGAILHLIDAQGSLAKAETPLLAGFCWHERLAIYEAAGAP